MADTLEKWEEDAQWFEARLGKLSDFTLELLCERVAILWADGWHEAEAREEVLEKYKERNK